MHVKQFAAAATTIALVTAACTSSGTLDTDGWIEVGSVDRLLERGVVYLEEHNVFVVASDDGIPGLLGQAQHVEDDPVLYCARSDGFEGPRHGKRFDRQGRYLGGPAQADMDRVRVRVQGTILSVNPSSVIRATGRSADSTPPAGPQCIGTENPPGFFDTS